MSVPPFEFPRSSAFLNRGAELAAMEEWWSSDDPDALLVVGRRRVGKSWLLRRFAHRKPAVILVGERLPAGAQLTRFARELAPHLEGVVPVLRDLPELFRLLQGLATRRRLLVVIDEFPYLLPPVGRDRLDTLTAIQAALEERDASDLKLVLCGSHLSVMEELLVEGSGLHGRLRPLRVAPMSLGDSAPFIEEPDPLRRMTRYAVSGGMPRALSLLGSGGTLRERVCRTVLDPLGPLFNEPRDVLQQELRQADSYFAILETLAGSRQMSSGDIARAIGRQDTAMPALLDTLRQMDLVERVLPFGAPRRAHGHHRLRDPFLRFWFRFVFPFQESLAAGLAPETLWDGRIEPALAEHVSWIFEDQCRRWVRATHGDIAPQVAAWSGTAAPRRRDPDRRSEEIDIVGGSGRRVRVVGECRWRAAGMDRSVLTDLERHKLPALVHGGAVAPDPRIVLISRSGFSPGLLAEAGARADVELVGADRVVRDLLADAR
jgi:AAA+ ATPase superfamily predicted ATPase